MKTGILGSLLCVFLYPAQVFAENQWRLVSKSVNGAEYFVYLSDVIDAGDFLYVKTLINYSQRQETGEISSISDEIISCSQVMVKTTRMSTYSKKNARGKKLTDHDLVEYKLDTWLSMQRGSVNFDYVKRLCTYFGR